MIQDLNQKYRSEPTAALVAADVEARKQVGLQRYGTLLQAFNGRDVLMDAYQEALDLLVYLRQCIEEGWPLQGTYDRCVMPVALRLRGMIEKRAEVDADENPGSGSDDPGLAE